MSTAPPILPPKSDKENRLHELLTRPRDQRLREYKYRFGQSVVFGIPVIALNFWGGALGPVDWQRWSSLLQSLLCGWVVYVNLGMLIEGMIDRRLRFRGDFIIALLAVVFYAVSLISALRGIITSSLWYPTLFHVVVLVLAMWSGWKSFTFPGRRASVST
jgi:hypothetical protein